MPKQRDSINRELFDELSEFNPVPYDSSGNDSGVPEEAEFIQFHFHKNGRDYGTITVSLEGVNRLKVYYNNKITRSDKSDDDGSSWLTLIKRLKHFAMNHRLSMDVENQDRLRAHMKKRQHQAKLDEGYTGTTRTSYPDKNPGNIKIIIKHNKLIGETDQRFRNISKIFLENELGERVLVPSTKPTVARAFARHLAEGGLVNDSRWLHINQLNEDLSALSSFVRANKFRTLSESVVSIQNKVITECDYIRESIKRISGTRGYNTYFESWQAQDLEEHDYSKLAQLFENSDDPRIQRALPVLARRMPEIKPLNELDEFESWADGVINERLYPDNQRQVEELISLIGPDSEILTLGPDAINAIGEISDLIEDDRLYDRLRLAADNNSDNDARPIIISWMEENSDNYDYQQVLKAINVEQDLDKSADTDIATNTETNTSSVPDLAAAANQSDQNNDTDQLPLPDLATASDQEQTNIGESLNLITRLKQLSGI